MHPDGYNYLTLTADDTILCGNTILNPGACRHGKNFV